MSRKSVVVAELQAEEAAVGSPLRRSSRISVANSSTPGAIGTRRTSQNEPPTTNGTPAKATRGRRASASQDVATEEVLSETKPTPRGRRASILVEEDSSTTKSQTKASSKTQEEDKPQTSRTRGRKTSTSSETSEQAEEKKKPARGRRTSTSSESTNTETTGEKKEPVKSRRRSTASNEPEETQSKPVRGRRTSTNSTTDELDTLKPVQSRKGSTADKSPSVEPEKRTTRSRKSSVSKENEEESTPAKTTRARRGSTSGEDQKENSVKEKKTSSRRASADQEEEEEKPKVSTPVVTRTRRRPSITENAVLLDPIDEASPSKNQEKSTLPTKKTDLDLSVINESLSEEVELRKLLTEEDNSKKEPSPEKPSTPKARSLFSPEVRRSPRLSKSPDVGSSTKINNSPEAIKTSPRIANQKSLQNMANKTDVSTEKSDTEYISNGKDGSFSFHLNSSVLDSSQDEVKEVNKPSAITNEGEAVNSSNTIADLENDPSEFNTSRISNNSDKENISTLSNLKGQQDTLQDVVEKKSKSEELKEVLAVRVSNVFRPKMLESSFCEPMEVEDFPSSMNKSTFNSTVLKLNETSVMVEDDKMAQQNEEIIKDFKNDSQVDDSFKLCLTMSEEQLDETKLNETALEKEKSPEKLQQQKTVTNVNTSLSAELTSEIEVSRRSSSRKSRSPTLKITKNFENDNEVSKLRRSLRKSKSPLTEKAGEHTEAKTPLLCSDNLKVVILSENLEVEKKAKSFTESKSPVAVDKSTSPLKHNLRNTDTVEDISKVTSGKSESVELQEISKKSDEKKLTPEREFKSSEEIPNKCEDHSRTTTPTIQLFLHTNKEETISESSAQSPLQTAKSEKSVDYSFDVPTDDDEDDIFEELPNPVKKTEADYDDDEDECESDEFGKSPTSENEILKNSRCKSPQKRKSSSPEKEAKKLKLLEEDEDESPKKTISHPSDVEVCKNDITPVNKNDEADTLVDSEPLNKEENISKNITSKKASSSAGLEEDDVEVILNEDNLNTNNFEEGGEHTSLIKTGQIEDEKISESSANIDTIAQEAKEDSGYLTALQSSSKNDIVNDCTVISPINIDEHIADINTAKSIHAVESCEEANVEDKCGKHLDNDEEMVTSTIQSKDDLKPSKETVNPTIEIQSSVKKSDKVEKISILGKDDESDSLEKSVIKEAMDVLQTPENTVELKLNTEDTEDIKTVDRNKPKEIVSTYIDLKANNQENPNNTCSEEIDASKESKNKEKSLIDDSPTDGDEHLETSLNSDDVGEPASVKKMKKKKRKSQISMCDKPNTNMEVEQQPIEMELNENAKHQRTSLLEVSTSDLLKESHCEEVSSVRKKKSLKKKTKTSISIEDMHIECNTNEEIDDSKHSEEILDDNISKIKSKKKKMKTSDEDIIVNETTENSDIDHLTKESGDLPVNISKTKKSKKHKKSINIATTLENADRKFDRAKKIECKALKESIPFDIEAILPIPKSALLENANRAVETAGRIDGNALKESIPFDIEAILGIPMSGLLENANSVFEMAQRNEGTGLNESGSIDIHAILEKANREAKRAKRFERKALTGIDALIKNTDREVERAERIERKALKGLHSLDINAILENTDREVERAERIERKALKESLEGFANSKMDKFLEKKLEEIDENSDESCSEESEEESYEDNEYLDNMAEEGEEDTPSEGSNDIIDYGESVGSSESELEEEDEYENDSFVCDEEIDELLSGEEYDLGGEKTKLKKKSRIICLSSDHEDGDNIKIKRKEKPPEEPKKRTRIVSISSDSSEEEPKDLNVVSPEVVPLLSPSKIIEVKEQIIRKRNSSITIQENLSIDCIKDNTFTERITKVVNSFCSTLHEKGKISLNLSIESIPVEDDNKTSTEKSPKTEKKDVVGSPEEIIQFSSLVNRSMSETDIKDRSISNRSSTSESYKNESSMSCLSSLFKSEENLEFDDAPAVTSRKLSCSDSIKDTINTSKKSSKKRLSKSLERLDGCDKKIKRQKLTHEVEEAKVNKDAQVKKSKKKKNKSKKPKNQPASSMDDLRTETFNLMNQLITDVKNRPARIIKPSNSAENIDSSWIIDTNVNDLKPSTTVVSAKEKKMKIHPKDFKNQTLYATSHVKRINTKNLLKKKGA